MGQVKSAIQTSWCGGRSQEVKEPRRSSSDVPACPDESAEGYERGREQSGHKYRPLRDTASSSGGVCDSNPSSAERIEKHRGSVKKGDNAGAGVGVVGGSADEDLKKKCNAHLLKFSNHTKDRPTSKRLPQYANFGRHQRVR